MTAVLSESISKPARAWAFLTQVYMTMAQGDVAWQKRPACCPDINIAAAFSELQRASLEKALPLAPSCLQA